MTDTLTRPAVDIGPRTSARATARRSLLPLAGPAAIVAAIAAEGIVGSAPGTDASNAQVLDFWSQGRTGIAAFVFQFAGILLAAFGAGLYGRLRAAGDSGPLPIAAAVGAGIAALGLILEGNLALALADAARQDQGLASLHVLYSDLFMPIVAGMCVLLGAAGLSSRATGALPPALIWPALVLSAVAPLYAAGFAAYVGGGLWVAVAGTVLFTRR